MAACLAMESTIYEPTPDLRELAADEVMRRWPATIAVMLRHRLLCVGCPVGRLHSIIDICRVHGLDETAFVGELLEAVANG